MTTLRTRLFVFATMIILIILGISVAIVVLVKKKAPVEVPAETATTTIDATNIGEQIMPKPVTVPPGSAVKPLTAEETLKNAAKQMAKIFVERYGTYSSDSDYANIRELEELVTADLWKTLEKRIGTTRPEQFIGVTTNAVASEVKDFSDSKSTVEVMSQRIITKGTSTERKSETMTVRLVKNDGGWLVDGFEVAQ